MREYAISVVGMGANGVAITLKEIFGTSDELKPTNGVAMGSTFTEVDTGDIFLFNETTGEWVNQFSLQG